MAYSEITPVNQRSICASVLFNINFSPDYASKDIVFLNKDFQPNSVRSVDVSLNPQCCVGNLF
jgi:hypothetical protein